MGSGRGPHATRNDPDKDPEDGGNRTPGVRCERFSVWRFPSGGRDREREDFRV